MYVVPKVFQFTHPRGVRLLQCSGSDGAGQRFNSRTREGCDVAQGGADHWDEVSIHALARGATSLSSIPSGLFDKFQFTHPRGVRLRIHSLPSAFSLFQFTHPRGVRPFFYGRSKYVLLFQFTHPRGVRHSRSVPRGVTEEFQFTHPRGVRRGHRMGRLDTLCFNSRTHEGCDRR